MTDHHATAQALVAKLALSPQLEILAVRRIQGALEEAEEVAHEEADKAYESRLKLCATLGTQLEDRIRGLENALNVSEELRRQLLVKLERGTPE